MNLRILHYSDLEKLGYGTRVTVWRKVNAGLFPKPVIKEGYPVWKEQDVINYFESLPVFDQLRTSAV